MSEVGLSARRKKPQLSLPVEVTTQDKNTQSYTIGSDGAFVEGDFSISREGISISSSGTFGGTTTPSAALSTTGAPVPAVTLPVSLVLPGTPDRERVSIDNVPSPKPLAHVPLHQIVEEEIRDIRFADLRLIRQLGRGSGGVVHSVLYKPKRKLMAMKVIPLDVTDQVRKQILLELRTLYQAQSPHIVKFYGGFFTDGHIQICLELMDAGSLESLSKKIGPFPEPILASVATQVLKGLLYLHKEKKLVHRDIKPSNILINSRGEVKISDFGVSGQLASSISSCVSWVGTVTYMSPERIQGKSYTVQSDIWSFGLSMVELALGRFPYKIPEAQPEQAKQQQQQQQQQQGEDQFGFFDLLSIIVDQDPDIPHDKYSAQFAHFIEACLKKTPTERMSTTALLEHPFITTFAASEPVDMVAWIQPHVVKNDEDQTALNQALLQTPSLESFGSPIPRHMLPLGADGRSSNTSPPTGFSLGAPLAASSGSSESLQSNASSIAHDRSGSLGSHARSSSLSGHDRSASHTGVASTHDRSPSRTSTTDSAASDIERPMDMPRTSSFSGSRGDKRSSIIGRIMSLKPF